MADRVGPSFTLTKTFNTKLSTIMPNIINPEQKIKVVMDLNLSLVVLNLLSMMYGRYSRSSSCLSWEKYITTAATNFILSMYVQSTRS